MIINLFLKSILCIVRGEHSKALLLIFHLITMADDQLEPYEELILSVKRKKETQGSQ